MTSSYAGGSTGVQLLVAQGNPPYHELNRLGSGWSVQTTTLFAPLVARPGTTAILEIYNNATSGMTMSVDDLFAEQILSTAASQTYAIYAMVSTQKAVPSLTALSVQSSSSRAFYTTTASSKVVTGVSTTVVDNGWRPWGSVQAWGTATATPGNGWNAPVDGRLIVPPGASLCLHVVGALATASTFQVGAHWFEIPFTNNTI